MSDMLFDFLPYLVIAGIALLFFDKAMPFMRPSEKEAEDRFDTTKLPF